MVVLNRIYTRTGDDGTTALGSGERRPKHDLRVGAYGTVDETNAAIGIVRLHLADAHGPDAMLRLIQHELFAPVAHLAGPPPAGDSAAARLPSSSSADAGPLRAAPSGGRGVPYALGLTGAPAAAINCCVF